MKTVFDTEKFHKALDTAPNHIHFFDLVFWEIVKPWKGEIFTQSINDGMHWEAAYQRAKKVKKPK